MTKAAPDDSDAAISQLKSGVGTLAVIGSTLGARLALAASLAHWDPPFSRGRYEIDYPSSHTGVPGLALGLYALSKKQLPVAMESP